MRAEHGTLCTSLDKGALTQQKELLSTTLKRCPKRTKPNRQTSTRPKLQIQQSSILAREASIQASKPASLHADNNTF